jgi:hypothetical protein
MQQQQNQVHIAMVDISLSWDEKWTWKHPDFYFLFVSYERFDGKCLTSEQPTGNIVWMALRRGAEEPRIGSAQVDMPRASAAPYHGRCR